MSVDAAAAAADGRRRGEGERELVVVGRGIRDAKPVLAKIGIAFALSFAGFVVSRLRPRSGTTSPRSNSTPSADEELETDGKSDCGCLHDELRVPKSEEPSEMIVNGISTIAAATPIPASAVVELSPTSNSSGDVEGFLLPEFNDFAIQEFEVKNKELESALIATMSEEPELQEEIAHLRELVFSLQEKERSLELQLLENRGVKEKEDAARELENRLKISATEAKLYGLKIDSLQAENQRLQDELAEYSKSIKELEAARAEINRLERKMKLDEEKKKEILVSLHQKISSLQQREEKDMEDHAVIEKKLKRLEELENETVELKMMNSRLSEEISDLTGKLESSQMTMSAVIEKKLKRLEELENETVELKMMNSRLSEEISDLTGKLESSQMTMSSVLDDAKVEALEEASNLRKVNEKLMEETEQLRTDRYADVEELVYLRWINACLRYELRNYQPSLGRTIARDLSRCLSPKSEEKAKHLILEYANLGTDDKVLDFGEVDSEYSYSSQASAGEPEDVSIDASSSARHTGSKRGKILSKLKKLVIGKSKQKNGVSAEGRTSTSVKSDRRASVSTCSIDDIIGRDSYDSLSSCVIDEVAIKNLLAGTKAETIERLHHNEVSFPVTSRLSLDIQRLRRLDQEEKKILSVSDRMMANGYKRVSFSEDTSIVCSKNTTDQEDTCIPEKVQIKKFADVLRSSRGRIPKVDRRSSSCRY